MKTNTPLRFFVVENHQDTLDAIKMFLEGQGHTVAAAPDMKSALKLAPRAEFDILISDIGLPDGDGWELLTRLREKMPDVKAIAMSGYGMRADLDKSKTAGYAAHLVKPFGPVELAAALKKVLGATPAPAAKSS
ncbi:MAG TPA: response regulator [Candidatus Limnocylindria bacterium]|nr:response regulator [Candidatus Limnocylindria bacterium]